MQKPVRKKTAQGRVGRFITVPGFSPGDGVHHFFGTRDEPKDLYAPFKTTRPGSKGSPLPTAVVSVKQVHGTDALVVDRPIEPETTFAGAWDAVVTNQPGVLITVRTADCVPVLLHDPVGHVVAAIHSGWRGSVAGIVPKTLTRMQREFGSQLDTIQVAIGPSAGVCCYEVDEPVLKPLRAYPFWKLVVRERGTGRALLDLRTFIGCQIRAAGVPPSHISTVSLCTICRPELFYSYRREGVVNATMTSGIMLSQRPGRTPRPPSRKRAGP